MSEIIKFIPCIITFYSYLLTGIPTIYELILCDNSFYSKFPVL